MDEKTLAAIRNRVAGRRAVIGTMNGFATRAMTKAEWTAMVVDEEALLAEVDKLLEFAFGEDAKQ